MASSVNIAGLLDKMDSGDFDIRFMAMKDLMTELQREGFRLDERMQNMVVSKLLKLLTTDKNGEVQNQVVKCLPLLADKVDVKLVRDIANTLATNMLSDKVELQLRDISTMGLKAVIAHLSSTAPSSAELCLGLTERLTRALDMIIADPIRLETLDIISDLLTRFGKKIAPYHPALQQALIRQLQHPRTAVRKHAITALGQLVPICAEDLFGSLVAYLRDSLQTTKDADMRTVVQCAVAVCREGGERLGEDNIKAIVPLISQCARVEEDDELRESCIQVFEALAIRCPRIFSPFVDHVLAMAVECLEYDPNYNYDEDEEEGGDMDVDDEGNSEEEEDYSDDDDMTWKVRRAASKFIGALIKYRSDLLPSFCQFIAPKLIARFKEREENVRTDIFLTFGIMLKQTRAAVSAMSMDASSDDQISPLALLQAQVPLIVRTMAKQLKDKSFKIRQGAISLLKELNSVQDGLIGDQIGVLIPGLCFCLMDKSSSTNIKIDTLALLEALLKTTPPSTVHPHLERLLPSVVACINDSFYKIVAEALCVATQLTHTIRPVESESANPAFNDIVHRLYHACLERLNATDIDQEVKERSIICMGHLLARLGDVLADRLQQCLPIFLARLQNEITRVTATKALGVMASSAIRVDLTPILADAVQALGEFLRKNNRTMRVSSLQTLNILVRIYGASMTPLQVAQVLSELPSLVDAGDLHASQLALGLTQLIVEQHRELGPQLYEVGLLTAAVGLAQSNLLQGGALQALLSLFRVLASSYMPGFTFNELLRLLLVPVEDAVQGTLLITRPALASISKLIAVLTEVNPDQTVPLVACFLGNVRQGVAEPLLVLSLLGVGEIGKTNDLSGHTDLLPTILSVFASPSEDIKTAAAYALGNLAVGNLGAFIPVIVHEITTQPSRQYVLLHALKELISTQSVSAGSVQALAPFVEQIWGLLFAHCDTSEEGVRNVVAECLGKLTLVNPSQLLPQLESRLEADSALSRATAITAFKFTTSAHSSSIDVLLKPLAPGIFARLRDENPDVRRVTLSTFNSTAHNKPHLIRDLLGELLPLLYNETNERPELIKEVQMGPFKHRVDDGLDARKSAFECMYTLLETCQDRLDMQGFLTCVVRGLHDLYDIKMLTFLILIRLARDFPGEILFCMDELAAALTKIIMEKAPKQAVKQEIEKSDELRRSALRAINAISQLEASDKSAPLQALLQTIHKDAFLRSRMASVQEKAAEEGEMDTSA